MGRVILPDSAKRILVLALPAIGEACLLNLLGVVDSLFISRVGLLAINAVGVTNIYSLTYMGIFTAVSTAISVFLSRSVGAGGLKQGRSIVGQGFMIALAAGFALALFSVLFSVPLLHAMGANQELQGMALPYFRVVLGVSPLMALFTAQSAAFRATGDTLTPLKVGLEMNVFHVALDYLLIIGVGPLTGFGLAGAAWAMVLARLYALVRLWRKSRGVPAIALNREDLYLQSLLLADMLRFTVPAAVERLSMRFGQILYFGLIVRMGTSTYAAHNIAGSLTVFASTIGSGFATAACVTIGQAIGRKDESALQSSRRWSYLLAASSMTLVTALICLSSPWLGLWYTRHPQVIHMLVIVLAIDILSQPFLASALVDTAVIQASGNSKYPMMVTTMGIWGVRTLGVAVFAWHLGWGLPAVWGCIAADNALRAFLFGRYRRKHFARPLPA